VKPGGGRSGGVGDEEWATRTCVEGWGGEGDGLEDGDEGAWWFAWHFRT
jgi:hypothetical protein